MYQIEVVWRIFTVQVYTFFILEAKVGALRA